MVAGDGARWIDTCTEKYFPHAVRCLDSFHVVKWANTALDKVRTQTAARAHKEYNARKKQYAAAEAEEQQARESARQSAEAARRELSAMPKPGRPSRHRRELEAFLEAYSLIDSEHSERPAKGPGRPRKEAFTAEYQQVLDEIASAAQKVKGARHALGHNPKKCSEAQLDKIRLIENEFPDLYRAYQLKETLWLILHMKDSEATMEELDRWLADAAASGLIPMQELAEKIARHRSNIRNTMAQQANSAKSEATNTTIKVLIRMAHGFRNLENMIALIYLKCSSLVIPLRNRPQPTAEQAAEDRKKANQLRTSRTASSCS